MANLKVLLTTSIGVLGVNLSVAASELNAFASVAGGIPDCTTFGPPAALSFYPSEPYAIPVCGYGNKMSGGVSTNVATSGPLTNSMSIAPVILGNPGYSGFYNGAANSTANYRSLSESAYGNISGGIPGNPSAQHASAGAASFADTLTASSPLVANGSAGYVRYQFSVDGSLAAPGTPGPYLFGSTYALLDIQQQNGPVYEIFNAHVDRGGLGIISGYSPPPGWATSMGSLSGGSTFYSLDLPMNWGQTWNLKVGLLAWAGGTADINFLTARLTGLELFNANHVQVTQFSIGSASGTDYLSAATVPIPAPIWLFGSGLFALIGVDKRGKAR